MNHIKICENILIDNLQKSNINNRALQMARYNQIGGM